MGSSKRKASGTTMGLLPRLTDLVLEVDDLTTQFKRLLKEFESGGELPEPLRGPLRYTWRPPLGEQPTAGVVAKVIEWTNALREHLAHLKRYYLDTPEKLAHFPLYPFLGGPMSLSADQVQRALQEHKELLLIEALRTGEPVPEVLSEQLRQARERQGLTQKDAAAKLGVSLETYQNWETGKNKPRPSNYLQIRKLLRGELQSGHQKQVPAESPTNSPS